MTIESIHYYLCLAAMENREGAWNLAEGNVAEALEIFANAINILDQLKRLPEISAFDLRRPHFCASVDVPFLMDGEQRYFTYGRAMVFFPLINHCCTIQEIAYYRGVVLFNIALANQTKGKVLKQARSLKKAVHYFEACLNAVTTIPTVCPDVDLLRIAALNNKAMILCEMLDFDEAKRAMDEVRHRWKHALALHYRSGTIGEEDIAGFILNTMEAFPPNVAACA
jgi:tetratricopeptide (TPR) repeat protein